MKRSVSSAAANAFGKEEKVMPGGAMSVPRQLPQPLRRTRIGGSLTEDVEVNLKTITPILGGGTRPRTIDEIDVVRVPSIRGRLRFWWRALSENPEITPAMLADAERGLWGGSASDEGARSAVEVTAEVTQHKATLDNGDIGFAHPHAYALWPARQTLGLLPAPRRPAGQAFTLRLRIPQEERESVLRALRAWILFDGYGGRTRRGCGSLTVVNTNLADWLPRKATLTELRRLLGKHAFTQDPAPKDFPRLAGAEIWKLGAPVQNPESAWSTAINLLKQFRQGPGKDPAFHAREAGLGNHPGRSRWPEADKIRLLDGKMGHRPLHNSNPAWPRAGFGLPIIVHFNNYSEPGDYEILWLEGDNQPHERLASPLILKPMPLEDGTFLPIALWLGRRYPEMGRVVIKRNLGTAAPLKPSLAEFGQLVANGDKPQFRLLAGYDAFPLENRLKFAFFDWVAKNPGAGRIV